MQPLQAPTVRVLKSTPATHECSLCEDVGYRGWKTPAAGYPVKEVTFCDCVYGKKAAAFWAGKESEAHQRKLGQLFANAGIPAHFRDMTIDTLVERVGADTGKQVAIEAVMQLVNQGYIVDERTNRYKPGVVVSGDFGRGKTGLLTPVLRNAVEAGKSALWVEVYDFISEVQRGYEDGSSLAKLEAAQRADIILLDDLGDKSRTKEETDDRRRIMYQLINYRHNNALPMLITTNLTGKELALQFGARTFERIAESCAWVSMTGRNLRME